MVFFPTALATHLGFLVQGPYRTTPSRDNIPRANMWNRRLVRETGSLLVETLRWFRDNSLLATDCTPPLEAVTYGGETVPPLTFAGPPL